MLQYWKVSYQDSLIWFMCYYYCSVHH